jgi:hypothetical protein
MPSRSRSQQKLFGLVRKCQNTGECSSPKVKKIADGIGEKDAEDFAKTKHKGLPDRVKKKKNSFKEWLQTKGD